MRIKTQAKPELFGNILLEMNPDRMTYFNSFSLNGFSVVHNEQGWIVYWDIMRIGEELAHAESHQKRLIIWFCMNYQHRLPYQENMALYVQQKRKARRKERNGRIKKSIKAAIRVWRKE